MICLGAVGLFAPDVFVAGAEYMLTTSGLYVIATFRVIVGVMLLLVASASRLPKTMRVFGVVALISGLSTPFIGVERAHAVFNWASGFGTGLIRLWGVVALVLGGIIIFAFAGRRRTSENG
jgi:hypothetical protein